MKILIFGSNGLVGSSLCRYLSKNKECTILESNRNDTDLFDYSSVVKKLSSTKPDIIINAAAKVGGIHANNTFRSSFLIENLKINLNILEASIGYDNLQIINLGSSCIYPLNVENPIKEDQIMSGKLEPTNSPYAMAKLTAIELGDAIHKDYGTKITNLMPTNLYGPNDNFHPEYSHVIPGLIKRMHDAKLMNKKSFSIWGSGKPLREFLYVDDLSKAVEFIIVNDINLPLINVGSGEEISILNLSRKIKNVIGYKGQIIFDNTMPDGINKKLLDSSILNHLGWRNKTNLDDGLKLTYDWFLKNAS